MSVNFGDESDDVLKSTQEASDFSLCPRCKHVKDGSDLIWIYLYPLSLTIYPKSFPEVTPKVHFLGFSLNLNCLILSTNLSRAAK